MVDIFIALALILTLSLIMFLAGIAVSRTKSRAAANLLASLIIVAIMLYVKFLWYDVRMARILPFSNVIVLGNWLPIAAGLLAGLAWRTVPGSKVRRSVSVGSLGIAGIIAAFAPLVGRAPDCGDRWDRRGFCVQTTSHTCSTACAASLLYLHDIDATEQEMARLCLTRQGTSWMGLYRGLKRKTKGSDWDVEVLSCSFDEADADDQGTDDPDRRLGRRFRC